MNINDMVLVKFTPAGLAVAKASGQYLREPEADGFVRIQLWQLMAAIGPKLGMTNRDPLIEGNEMRLEAPDPTPRAHETCRRALLSVIALDAKIGRTVVAAVQALMDLDGLRAGKELDEALVRDQDELRRKLSKAEAQAKATLAQSAELQATCVRLTEERDLEKTLADARAKGVTKAQDDLKRLAGRLAEHLNAMEHQLVMRDIDGARALLAKMRGSL